MPSDLPAMARIHCTSGTPGLLTDLGERFVRDVYYRGLIGSEHGKASVLDLAGDVRGFVTYSQDSSRLFREIFASQRVRALTEVGRSAIAKPSVIRDLLETVVTVTRGEASSDRCEIVSLEVARSSQGLGLGVVLLEKAVGDLRQISSAPIIARILADHPAVQRIYEDLGFKVGPKFRLHGRDWLVMESS